MPRNELINQVVSESPNRRRLLKTLGVAAGALGAVGDTPLSAQAGPPSPIDILQFALNLEYLEAEFYSIAVYGKTIEQRGQAINGSGGSGPTVTSYGKVNFGNSYILTGQVAVDIAADELAHVKLIRSALSAAGVMPIAKPAIDLDALATKGASLENEMTFLVLGRIFEDIGVSAYAGGAPYLSGSPYLQTAARILATEGEHVANIRLQIARLGIATKPPLDGADVLPPPSGSNFFSTNVANGLPPYRTSGQVLYLAYGNKSGATAGGFFPAGVNGFLNTSTGPATAANLS
jgi:hypothetical protein